MAGVHTIDLKVVDKVRLNDHFSLDQLHLFLQWQIPQ